MTSLPPSLDCRRHECPGDHHKKQVPRNRQVTEQLDKALRPGVDLRHGGDRTNRQDRASENVCRLMERIKVSDVREHQGLRSKVGV